MILWLYACLVFVLSKFLYHCLFGAEPLFSSVLCILIPEFFSINVIIVQVRRTEFSQYHCDKIEVLPKIPKIYLDSY